MNWLTNFGMVLNARGSRPYLCTTYIMHRCVMAANSILGVGSHLFLHIYSDCLYISHHLTARMKMNNVLIVISDLLNIMKFSKGH